jgi:uncharacterized protein (TIGR00255 family)
MKSMTGFGKSELSSEGRKIRVEVKSVNHRYLDVNIRMPRFLLFLEDDVRRYLKTVINRGRIDVFVNFSSEREDAKTVAVDMSVINGYLNAARRVEAELGVENDLKSADLLRLPDAVTFEENEADENALRSLLIEAVQTAAAQLISAREAEGAQLLADVNGRLKDILRFSEEIAQKEDIVLEEYRIKLKQRIESLMESVPVDETRLAQEIAIYADKCNVTEEIVRIKSHVDQFTCAVESGLPQGRNLDFIVQELNREFNTIGSKSGDAVITKMVIAGKVEIEKIREQIQNLE